MQIFYLTRHIPIEIGYDLGYLIGGILLRHAIFEIYSSKISGSGKSCLYIHEDKVGSYYLTALSALQTTDTVQFKDGSFILTNEIFIRMKKLINFVEYSLDKDLLLCQSKDFAKGVRAIFNRDKIFNCRRKKSLAEYIEQLFWYWFEEKMTIEKNVRNLYFIVQFVYG
jgi:hypothetical protein